MYWGMNRSRPRTTSLFKLFIFPTLRFILLEPRKRYSFLNYTVIFWQCVIVYDYPPEYRFTPRMFINSLIQEIFFFLHDEFFKSTIWYLIYSQIYISIPSLVDIVLLRLCLKQIKAMHRTTKTRKTDTPAITGSCWLSENACAWPRDISGMNANMQRFNVKRCLF